MRYCSASPFRRRDHRPAPPMTADSTSNDSHFQGARSVPERMGVPSSSIVDRPSSIVDRRRIADHAEEFIRRGHPSVGGLPFGSYLRHLAEREIFSKSLGGEVLDRTPENGQKRATRRMRAAAAAIEVRGNPGAGE